MTISATELLEPAPNTPSFMAGYGSKVIAVGSNMVPSGGHSLIAFCRSAGTAASQRWSLGITAGNKPTAFIADGSTYRVPTGAADWPTGRWCHIAVVRESGTARLYFAGSQVASNAGAVTSASAEQLTIGSMSHNYGPWPGLVAHAVVHTTALSAARIAARTIAAGL